MGPPARTFLTFQPALSGWLLAAGAAAVGALLFFLYRAQARGASRRLAISLVTIRLALAALVLGMLLRPMWVWSRTSVTPPTVWVAIDQSLSMARQDSQATPAERLNWADALGWLPPSAAPPRFRDVIARIIALRSELARLRKGATLSLDKNVPASLESARNWNKTLDEIALDLQAKLSAQSIEDTSRLVADLRAAAALPRAKPNPSPWPDDAEWRRLDALLDSVLSSLDPISAQADRQFLRKNLADPAMNAALKKVESLRRADLAGGLWPARAALRELTNGHRIKVMAFGESARIMHEGEAAPAPGIFQAAAEPTETATDLASALRAVSDHIGDGEPASVIILSDGRANVGDDPAPIARRLADRGVRVFTLAVGSRQAAPDVSIESIDAPQWVYKDDVVRVSAVVRMDALEGRPVVAEFRRGDALVESRTLTPTSTRGTQVLSFTDKPPAPGAYEYRVALLPLEGEATADNNSRRTSVLVKQDKLQVLLLENEPRWEYRYLANYLRRDERVHLQSVLLEPAAIEKITPPPSVRASPDNAGDEASLLPEGIAQWARFDLVIVGDVPPEYFSEEAQRDLARAVGDRGVTAVIVAGPLNMPSRYAAAPLSELLAVESSGDWTAAELADHAKSGFGVAPAPEGNASVLGRLGLDEASNARLWAAFPKWYWHAEQTRAKPAASVLWRAVETSALASASTDTADALLAARSKAILATLPVGSGRAMYLAADATWRLRQVGGENLHERFWGQVIRWAGAGDMPAGGHFVRFGVDPTRPLAGGPVNASARVLREDFTPATGLKFRAAATDAVGQATAQADMIESTDSPGVYHARFAGLPAGTFDISLVGADVQALLSRDTSPSLSTLRVEIESASRVERQNVNPDRPALSRLASDGAGLALDAEQADALIPYLESKGREETQTQEFGLFADPHSRPTRLAHWIFLALFVTLISTEWLLRKGGGLV